MPHDQHRTVGRRAPCVEPVDLVRCEEPGRATGNGRVEQGDAHARQVDPAVAGEARLAAVGVVVAAHDVQAVTELGAVARLERGELLVGAVGRQVALDDDGGRRRRRDLGHRGICSSSPGTGPRPVRRVGSGRPSARRSAPPRPRRSAGRSRSPPGTATRRAVAATCAPRCPTTRGRCRVRGRRSG